MWNVHWNIRDTEERIYWGFYDTSNDTFSMEFFSKYLIASSTIYALWAIPYFLLFSMEGQRYGELKVIKEKGYQGKFIYLVFHYLVFACSGCTIGLLSYFYQPMHILVIAVVSCISFWNGGKYYMEYFGRKYEVNLSLLEQKDKVE